MNADYSNYFLNRGVAPETYRSYKLPTYLADVIGDNCNISILDFGCGFGQNIKALSDAGYVNLVGYDIEPAAIGFCRDRGINVIDGNACDLTEVKEKFDLIIVMHVLEHIPKSSIIKTLRDLRSLLNDQGRIFVAVPNAQSNTGCYWRYEDFTHNTLFTAGALLYVLREAGFKDISLCDKDCLAGMQGYKKIARIFLLKIYRINKNFWNKVTGSSYHKPSPIVNSYEIKMLAKK